jgi:hypothetical protein
VKAGFYHFGLVGRGVEAELGEEDCGGIHAFLGSLFHVSTPINLNLDHSYKFSPINFEMFLIKKKKLI